VPCTAPRAQAAGACPRRHPTTWLRAVQQDLQPACRCTRQLQCALPPANTAEVAPERALQLTRGGACAPRPPRQRRPRLLRQPGRTSSGPAAAGWVPARPTRPAAPPAHTHAVCQANRDDLNTTNQSVLRLPQADAYSCAPHSACTSQLHTCVRAAWADPCGPQCMVHEQRAPCLSHGGNPLRRFQQPAARAPPVTTCTRPHAQCPGKQGGASACTHHARRQGRLRLQRDQDVARARGQRQQPPQRAAERGRAQRAAHGLPRGLMRLMHGVQVLHRRRL